jgi:NADPH:quinone reductase-like Zn-dependent oxidoreductase
MRAAVLESFQGPASVRIMEVPNPVPGPGEVLVRVTCSPVNPSDVLYCSGLYGKPPELPVTPGFEGCGQVVASGGGFVANRLMGKRVAGAVQSGRGFWAQYVVLKATECMAMPAGVTDESAASAFVNPLTAVALVRPVVSGKHTAMVQTAAASQLGRMIIRLSQRHAFPLINVVHRKSLVDELKSDGARHVLDSSAPGFRQDLTTLTHELRATWAADAVAGAMTGTLAASMPQGSTIAVYGVLSGEESRVNPGDLIFRGQTVTGFWLSSEFKDRGPLGLARIAMRMRKATSLLRSDLQTLAQAHLGLEGIATRLPDLLKSTSKGKIYIKPNA